MNESKNILQQIASLLLYQSVFKSKIGTAFIELLNDIDRYNELAENNSLSFLNLLETYGHWFKLIAATNRSWQDYLITRILQDDNPFSQQVQKVSIEQLPSSLIIAAKQDLQILQNIYNCSTQQISDRVQRISHSPVKIHAWNLENSVNTFLQSKQNWTDALEDLATYYRQHGTGIVAQYHALRWQKSQFIGIAHPDPIQLKEIIGYESQKEALKKNTEFLLAGYPALHVLLYGSRGSGKSSLVKALLPEYRDRGLRLIEVSKSELQNLPTIVEQLRDSPQKFIIFVDDLSFEEDDDAFKALKVVLEGSLTARANNIVVYATSNRRHLIREFFSDRPRPSDADEIHSWDNVQEKLSFSDRFGLTLTFEPPNQNTYLNIVNLLAEQAGITIEKTELEFRAKQWATRGNGRSGRTARQFIDYLRAELA
ncbi:MAG: ATP-binding protein [Xenococcaceae cyanobacterium MO_188.B32]|nr:ATP-binding protein [Xenococcaceae cyanobacterium MO_188.B32]